MLLGCMVPILIVYGPFDIGLWGFLYWQHSKVTFLARHFHSSFIIYVILVQILKYRDCCSDLMFCSVLNFYWFMVACNSGCEFHNSCLGLVTSCKYSWVSFCSLSSLLLLLFFIFFFFLLLLLLLPLTIYFPPGPHLKGSPVCFPIWSHHSLPHIRLLFKWG